MKYMLIFYSNEGDWLAMPDEERNAAAQRIGMWYGEQFGAGRIVQGCKLDGRSTARTVRLGPAGHSESPTISDGPFATEIKETIGAYAIIDVPDLDAALAVAGSWPGGGAVEVRPVTEG